MGAIMKKPNFFIIGAPKCGTTSLARYLREHPEICMSSIKEPQFFNTDMHFDKVKTLADYEALFKEAGSQHKAVGEASPGYLRSKEAVANIMNYNPAAKFIVLLRNPVDMAYSWHFHLLYMGHQRVEDFQVAWRTQEELAHSWRAKRSRGDREVLLYGHVCKVGEQVERLYQTVPRNRVLIALFDDLRSDPRQVYEDVLDFLGLASDNRSHFPVYNENKINRSAKLKYFSRLFTDLKRSLGIKSITGLLKKANSYNTLQVKRPPLPENLRIELVEYFQDDVKKLSTLIERDLSHWK